ncbi:hypothetical protein ABEB36_003320 [Hypothenemus hampei]|uniref:Uncharacterized protein n=1 Tax=Hypothenemus hampei TaxID=57062 RepID=A0ABD1FCE7_HYPHA
MAFRERLHPMKDTWGLFSNKHGGVFEFRYMEQREGKGTSRWDGGRRKNAQIPPTDQMIWLYYKEETLRCVHFKNFTSITIESLIFSLKIWNYGK